MLILNVVPGVYYSCSFSHIELLISPSGKPLDNGWNTGDIFGRLPSTLPSLENLVLILWRLLSGQGLVVPSLGLREIPQKIWALLVQQTDRQTEIQTSQIYI